MSYHVTLNGRRFGRSHDSRSAAEDAAIHVRKLNPGGVVTVERGRGAGAATPGKDSAPNT